MLKIQWPFVLRTTAQADLARERSLWTEKFAALALHHVRTDEHGQKISIELVNWLKSITKTITPRQVAMVIWAYSSQEKAHVFNCMQEVASVTFDRDGKKVTFSTSDYEWQLMAKFLDERGRETLETMAGYAIQMRQQAQDRDDFITSFEQKQEPLRKTP